MTNYIMTEIKTEELILLIHKFCDYRYAYDNGDLDFIERHDYYKIHSELQLYYADVITLYRIIYTNALRIKDLYYSSFNCCEFSFKDYGYKLKKKILNSDI